MASVKGYRGTLKVGLLVLDFIGAWSADIERELIEGKPPITSTSNGEKPVSPGALKATGSMEGEVTTGANAARAALITALMTGGLVDIALIQESGLTFDANTAYIAKASVNNDSEEVATISFEFQASGAFALADTI